MDLYEDLWPYPQEVNVSEQFDSPKAVRLEGDVLLDTYVHDLRNIAKIPLSSESDGYCINLTIDAAISKPEGYVIEVDRSTAKIAGADTAGLAYGFQTFLQLLAAFKKHGHWTRLEIRDWPAYRKRCFMIDMGRSCFSLPMLKRIVRILARLKMNQLHLHLYDDELCGLKFDGLPFGDENPFAITIKDLGALVEYASEYHVEIVPELEAWGHVGSLVAYYPNLRGGEGMYNGSSFLICEETFALMKKLIRQVVEVMPSKATIHLGLDEAKWFSAPSMDENFTPTDLVGRYYTILREIAHEQGKDLTMRIWADHGGRAVPREIQHNVIIEPWQYWKSNYSMIDLAIEKYSGKDKMSWMAGAGQSMGQCRGAYHATRYWCKQAADSPNVEGCNITFWGANNLSENFITLFAGSYYLWNPFSPAGFADLEDYEAFDRIVFPIMRRWRNCFAECSYDGMKEDQGAYVFNGFFFPSGKPVTPAVLEANTMGGHDFVNE